MQTNRLGALLLCCFLSLFHYAWPAFANSASAETAEDRKADTPRLYRVILPVTDIAKGQEFYSELLGMPGERVSPGRHYYDLGGTILALYDPAADGDPYGGGWKHHQNQYLYIAVTNLSEVLERARRLGAVAPDETIQSMPWGESLFYAHDPFGNPISFVDHETLFLGRPD